MKYAKEALIVRMAAAAISMLASFTIGIMILRSPKGLKSPYSRIIFGMSLSDFFLSLGMVISPFTSPKDTRDAIFSMGTTETCTATGWISSLGGISIPFYVLFLTYYFLVRVKYKVPPDQFAKREWIGHLMIWSWAAAGTSIGLAKHQYNTTRYGALCIFVEKPFGCWVFDKCQRGHGARTTSLIFVNIPLIAIFILLVCVLTTFTVYVYLQEKQLNVISKGDNNSSAQENEEAEHSMEPANISRLSEASEQPMLPIDNICEPSAAVSAISIGGVEEMHPTQDVNKFLSSLRSGRRRLTGPSTFLDGRSMTRESFYQSMLYISAFLVTYLIPVVGRLMMMAGQDIGDWSFWGLIPSGIGGLFNILIYTRPKILILQKNNGDQRCSWMRSFFAVIMSGGEITTPMEPYNV
ncbi:hypothetical protein CTEN210_11717 [Chaetoceros tenuissimus]|uniref:Uncharacterized protein n=1 Tax=Chaetoceros tenuissimus TaxID=426638 RepID=A0AAD3CZW6_9STRA|nr:hypothetical protein CTEN210_11717 [Chaetoceros tenuissimus]